VVTGGVYYNYGQTIRTYDLSGNFQWAKSYYDIYGAAIDSTGNIYTAGRLQNTTTPALRKFTNTGSASWTALPGYTMNGIAIDGIDNIYVVGNRNNNTTTHKYNSAGTLQYRLDHGAVVTGIAWFSPGAATVCPGLPLRYALATPVNVLSVVMPVLGILTALAPPLSSSPPMPPEWADLPVARIYRALLSAPGGDDLLAVPMASFQCVRRLGDSTWLTVTVPTYSPALKVALHARIGGELLINAGTRDSAGLEMMGLFLRATVTAVEYTREPSGAVITLTARVINPSYVSAARTISGIRRRSKDNGRWVITCDADPLLRPNDTVTAGAITFTVGSIRHAVRPHDAIMEVTEVAP
jgi:hypothetical protein